MIGIFIASFLVHAPVASPQPPIPSPPATTAQQPSTMDRQPLTLSGCVESDARSPAEYTLFDPHRGHMYRLTGQRLGLFVGRRVQVVGALVPTPNVAAQAGSIDPTTAAMAATTVNLSGTTPFNRPKVHVDRIRRAPGACRAP